MNLLLVKEISPRTGHKPIEWVLLTSLDVSTFEAAWSVIEYYEARWLVEEFHKALKTGCSIETRQLRRADRLEPLAALLSILAVRLLQLKTIANRDPERLAKNVVPDEMLLLLTKLNGRLSPTTLTIKGFLREVAKQGGFIGRKSDGSPGWQTIWKGWMHLQTLYRGFRLASKQ